MDKRLSRENHQFPVHNSSGFVGTDRSAMLRFGNQCAMLRVICALGLVCFAHSVFIPSFSHVASTVKVRACAQPRILSLKAKGDGKEDKKRVSGSFKEFAKSPLGAIWLITGVVGVIAGISRKPALVVVWQQLGSISSISTIGVLLSGTLPLAKL